MRISEARNSYKTDHNPGQAIYPRTQKQYHYNIARLKIQRGGKTNVFELDVDPERAFEFRHGKEMDVRDVLKVQRVFADVSTACFAKNTELHEVFGTDDVLEVAKVILEKGEIQPSAAEAQKLHNQKKERLFTAIKQCALHEQGQPISDTDIEQAMKKAKISIDLHEPDAWLLRKILEAMPHLKIGIQAFDLVFFPQDISKVKHSLVVHAKITKAEMLVDGRWHAIIEVPLGIKDTLFDALNNATHGKFDKKAIRSSVL